MTAADFTEPYDMPAPSKRERPRAATIADLRVTEAAILAALTYSRPLPPPPHDLDAEDMIAEAAIVGHLTEVDTTDLTPADFYGDTGRVIFTLWASPQRPAACDIQAWHAALADSGLRGAVAEELVRIVNDGPTARTAHLRRQVDAILAASRQRRVLDLLTHAEALLRSRPPASDVARSLLQQAIEAL